MLRKLTIPAPLQRLHVSGLVPGGTPVPPIINHPIEYTTFNVCRVQKCIIRDAVTEKKKKKEKENVIPQVSQGKSVWKSTVFVHPCTASMNDSSRET